MKIGIIGHGFVGRAISSFYRTNLIYDKFKPSLPLKEVVEAAEVIFVCVPTNGTREGYNYQPLKETIQLLSLTGIVSRSSSNQPLNRGKSIFFRETTPNLGYFLIQSFWIRLPPRRTLPIRRTLPVRFSVYLKGNPCPEKDGFTNFLIHLRYPLLLRLLSQQKHLN